MSKTQNGKTNIAREFNEEVNKSKNLRKKKLL